MYRYGCRRKCRAGRRWSEWFYRVCTRDAFPGRRHGEGLAVARSLASYGAGSSPTSPHGGSERPGWGLLRETDALDTEQKMKLSIIICTYNRAASLAETLR